MSTEHFLVFCENPITDGEMLMTGLTVKVSVLFRRLLHVWWHC
jgi:hypothetical protein